MKAIIIAIIILFATSASAQDLTGLWKAPNGQVLFVVTKGLNDIKIVTTFNRDDTGSITVTLEGEVKNTDGKLTIEAESATSFPIYYQGKQCQVTPLLWVEGYLLGQFGGRIFRATGVIILLIICSGELIEFNGGNSPIIDLSGIWR